jgi:hypothetical protein
MNLKLLIAFIFFISSHLTFAEGEKPNKDKKKKKSKTTVLAEQKIETFSFEKSGEIISKQTTTKEWTQTFGGDPILFSITSKKKTVAIGETVEIKVVAQLMDAAAANYFVFEELKGYTLKVVMPKSFIHTGGSYQDYIRGELSPITNRIEYTIIGKFEGQCNDCEFKLLRGKLNAESSDVFVLKDKFTLPMLKNNINQSTKRTSEYSTIESDLIASTNTLDPDIRITKFWIPNACTLAGVISNYNIEITNNSSTTRTLYSYIAATDHQGDAMQAYDTNVLEIPANSSKIFNLSDYVTIYNKQTLYVFLHNTIKQRGQVVELNHIAFESKNLNSNEFNFTIEGGENTVFPNYSQISAYNCPNGAILSWTINGVPGSNPPNDPDERLIFVKDIGTNYVTINCKLSETCTKSVSKTVIISHDCNSLLTPQLSISPAAVTKGAGFAITASNCVGDIIWYKDNNVYPNQNEKILNTNQFGTYIVSCKLLECQTPKVSLPLTPTIVDLWIKHTVPNNQILSNQSFTLEAEGCTDGYIDWGLPNGTTLTNTNPITVSDAGTYLANCKNRFSNAIISSSSVTFTLKSADRPILNKSTIDCIYDNQTTMLNATCSSGMTVKWFNENNAATNISYKMANPGTYSAQCCNGTNCGPSESIYVCRINPGAINIFSNKEDSTGKTAAFPTEAVLLTAEGCDYGIIKWDIRGQILWGRSITVYGSGVYKAQCFVTDRSFGGWSSYEVNAKSPGGVNILSSNQSAHSDQMITLIAQGCANGFVKWEYTKNNIKYAEVGNSIDVVGPGTYKAWCISFGKSSAISTITIPQAPSNAPKIIVDNTKVRPNESFTFRVDYSGCINAQWWGGQTLITQNGVTRSEWGLYPTQVTGPAILEAQCGDRPWDKQIKEIFLAPGDNLRLVSNKNKAKPTLDPPVSGIPPGEPVLLTTYGCDYGFIEWQIGDVLDVTATVLNPKRQRTEYGPGYYKARCMGDFSTNTDWVTVFVGSDGSITPLIDGPSRMCPNTATTITTTGCPYGYYNLWNTIENGGWQYGGNSITIYTPQTVKFRCNKDDNSFASEEKSLLVEPAFPDDVKAKNNGPVVLGNPASITATDIPGATYLWTVPSGALFSNLNSRALQVASAGDAYAGEYSVRVTYGSCALDLKTTLEISACENLYIKAYNPITGTETNKLTRKPGVANKNEYEELILEVQTLDGKVIKTMDYTWEPNPNLIKSSNINEQYKAQTAKMGHYAVTVSKNTITCPLSIDIFAEPCTVVGDLFTCGTPGGAANNNDQVNISNLAVGDEFTTSDYTILVTEMESGSQTAGWKGKGKLIFNFLKLSNNLALQIPISVTFTGIKINQCYQLYNGTVITEYDPSWGSVVDVSCLLDFDKRLSSVYSDARNLYDCSVEGKARIQRFIVEVDNLFPCLEQSLDYSLAGKTVIKDSLNKLKTLANEIIDYANDPDCDLSYANARIATGPPGSGSKKKFDAMTSIINFLGVAVDDPNYQKCHPTERGNIYSWMLKMTDGDYKGNFAEGQVAHHIIQNKYRLLYGGSTVESEYYIPRSSIKGNQGYADIVNFTSKEIFEIKSDNGESQGQKEVELYVNQANKYCPPSSGGLWGKGIGFPQFSFIWPLDPTKEIIVRQRIPGVIIYGFDSRKPQTVPAPVYEPIPVATQERLRQLLRQLLKEPSPQVRERMITAFYAGLSTGVVIALISTGVVGEIAAVIETYFSGGTLAPAAAVQIGICTAFIVIGVETLKTR